MATPQGDGVSLGSGTKGDQAMSARDFLTQEMQRIASEIQEINRQKKIEVGKKKAAILQAEAELKSPNPLTQFVFQPVIRGVKQCPECAALKNIQSPLENNPWETGTATEDFLRCTICHYTCSIPV